MWRDGREVEGERLLSVCRGLNPYPGFESQSLRHKGSGARSSMDRVSPSEGEGWWFEPTRARQFLDGRPLPHDDGFMKLALEQARRAERAGEVPVGAVVVIGGQVISRGRNVREARNDVAGHAEIVALRRAARSRRDWRFDGATVYVTLEPCPMCVGAMLSVRVKRLVYGAADPRAGAAGTVLNLADYPGLPHHLDVVSGIRADECAQLMRTFFARRRVH